MACSNFPRPARLPASLAAAVVIVALASAGYTTVVSRPDAAAAIPSELLKSLVYIDFALGR